jgi:hypothetical protein
VSARITPVLTAAPGSIVIGAANRMTADLDPAPSPDPAEPTPPSGGGSGWVRPVVLVASCLVIGFVGGWILRGDDGPVTVLPPSATQDPGDTGSVTAGATTGANTPTAPATTAPEEPAAPPDRADISLAVLNGTSRAGYAADVSGQAEGLGYVGVEAGNAPATTTSTVYFRAGQRAAAERVAKDLQVTEVTALPGSGALATAAPAGAEVILVLGTSSG